MEGSVHSVQTDDFATHARGASEGPNDEAAVKSELRQQLVRALRGEGAHASYAAVLRGFPAEWAGAAVSGSPHTAWRLLEHLRIAQWDILEFSRNQEHESPAFPDGYWPGTDAPPDAGAWRHSVAAFLEDLDAMIAMVRDESIDLVAPLPHTDGVSLYREALLLADHNAYHLGQLVLLRRILEATQGG
jgi:hypothetical protein